MGSKKKRIKPFFVPRTAYTEFRQQLYELLKTSDSFSYTYLRECVESKLLDPEFSDPPASRRSAAIDKWLSIEVQNGDTNQRLMFADESDTFGAYADCCFSFPALRHWVRKLISETIGDSPDWDSLKGSFSGGASTSQKRGVGTVPRKYLDGVDCTSAAWPHFQKLNQSVHWSPSPNFVEGNVLFTVPKSTTIDRVACKEPDLNMYCQKAVGSHIRDCLKRKGIDLNNQKINQELAYLGSLHGELATVDLSSASDTVTTQLVIELLPFEWSSLMLDLRSPFTRIDGELHENNMFSSMGNAFTFELESLIFWALTRAVCYFTGTRGRVSVFGDDIICPASVRDTLTEVLTFCGFKINLKKSHFEGPFRESCGKHYLGGKEVTPFYIRKVPEDASDWIHILNSLRRWLSGHTILDFLDGDWYQLWYKYSLLVPPPVKGGWDYDRRDVLVCPGRRPIARLAPKQRRAKRQEELYQVGAYLQWLDTAEIRTGYVEEATLVTSVFTTDGQLSLRRFQTPIWSRPIPIFIQEIEC